MSTTIQTLTVEELETKYETADVHYYNLDLLNDLGKIFPNIEWRVIEVTVRATIEGNLGRTNETVLRRIVDNLETGFAPGGASEAFFLDVFNREFSPTSRSRSCGERLAWGSEREVVCVPPLHYDYDDPEDEMEFEWIISYEV